MKKLLVLATVIGLLMMMFISVCYADEELVSIDKSTKILYFNEKAWYMLPMTGPTGKTKMLKKWNLPSGWQVRGMFTNKLLAVIKWDGTIEFK